MRPVSKNETGIKQISRALLPTTSTLACLCFVHAAGPLVRRVRVVRGSVQKFLKQRVGVPVLNYFLVNHLEYSTAVPLWVKWRGSAGQTTCS